MTSALLDSVLANLRGELIRLRINREARDRGVGAREISEAITNLETAVLWIRTAIEKEQKGGEI